MTTSLTNQVICKKHLIFSLKVTAQASTIENPCLKNQIILKLSISIQVMLYACQMISFSY